MPRLMNADLVALLEEHGWTVNPGLFSWSAVSPWMFERPTPAEFRDDYRFDSYIHTRRLHWEVYDTNAEHGGQFKNMRYQAHAPWDEEMIMPVTRSRLVELIRERGRTTLPRYEVAECCGVQYVRLPAGSVRVGDRIVAMPPGQDLGDGVTDFRVGAVEVTQIHMDADGTLRYEWDPASAPEWITSGEHMSAWSRAHMVAIVPRAEHLSAAALPVRHLESARTVHTRDGVKPSAACGRPVEDVRTDTDFYSVTPSLTHVTCRACYRNRASSAVADVPA